MDKNLLRERLLARRVIDETTGCWLWTGAKTPPGYGHMWNPIEKKVRRVPRLAFETWRGPIPAGLHVLHTCDVPACFNPDHLFLGTRSDNMLDAERKGRVVHRAGDLTEDAILAIFRDPRSLRAIGAEYGIDGANVHHIKSGKRWRHITNPDAPRGYYKLSADQVRAIRVDERSQAVLAAEYGVGQSTISRVRSGKRYGHVKRTA